MPSYFKIARRHLLHNKVYSFVNILGLSLGVCACIIIFLVADFEFSYDSFHPDKDRIYLLSLTIQGPEGKKIYFQTAPPPSSSAMRQELTGLDEVAGFLHFGGSIAVPEGGRKQKKFTNKIDGSWIPACIIAEPQYFSIFKYDWLAGDARSALNDPFKVVLTESKARKYFGSVPLPDMIGKTVIYRDSLLVQVSGIVKDWEGNTDFPYTDIISFSTINNSFLRNNIQLSEWQQKDVWVLAKLSRGASAAAVNAQLAALVKRHVKVDPTKDNKLLDLSLTLRPMSKLHFDQDYEENEIRTADLGHIYVLTGIALFILALAVANFINLSTAQASQRAKEIGVRKTLGGRRIGLIVQFLTETFVIACLSMLVAILLVNPALAAFHSFIPPGLTFHVLNPFSVLFLGIITIITTVLAGFFPALVLTRYSPTEHLRGNELHRGWGRWNFRNSLIVFQFSITLVFIISIMIIGNQFQFIRNKSLGFNSDAIIVVRTDEEDNTSEKMRVFARNVMELPGVAGVALESRPPLSGVDQGMKAIYKGAADVEVPMARQDGDENFIGLYHMQLLAGSNLSQSDSLKEFVINETCSKFLGFKSPDRAVGQLLYVKNRAFPIVGVVADFHQHSFHEPIKPMCIVNVPDRERQVAIKLSVGGHDLKDAKRTITSISQQFKHIYPKSTFDYAFFDESIAQLYARDQNLRQLMNIAMVVSIFVSCLGLFGFIMFITERRAREIGIRKVMGASVINIATLLSKDFVILITIALGIASPIAFYVMDNWLHQFAYRVDIGWWVFLLAGLSMLLITLITVGFHTIKAALVNPTKSLKTQ